MALGYTIASILKRSSHVFSDDKVSVKIDWLEQLKRHYVQVQGRDRLSVSSVAEKLGLEGSYVPRTYIEQIQLEKLVDEVMAIPDDLKTKFNIDEDLVSFSPREALSRSSTDKVLMQNKINGRLCHSYGAQGDKALSKLTGLAFKDRRFDRNPESQAVLANEGVITQLSEQISTLNERMDEFTSQVEELNSNFTSKVSTSHQNLYSQAEARNGSLIPALGNGSRLPNSSSSSQLAKESPLLDEIIVLARGQRQLMHQLDILSNFVHEKWGGRSRKAKTKRRSWMIDYEFNGLPLVLTVAIGGVGLLLYKGLSSRN